MSMGCLGGEANFPRVLKEMELVFGDVLQAEDKGGQRKNDQDIRAAGFAKPAEVTKLNRRMKYGRCL